MQPRACASEPVPSDASMSSAQSWLEFKLRKILSHETLVIRIIEHAFVPDRDQIHDLCGSVAGGLPHATGVAGEAGERRHCREPRQGPVGRTGVRRALQTGRGGDWLKSHRTGRQTLCSRQPDSMSITCVSLWIWWFEMWAHVSRPGYLDLGLGWIADCSENDAVSSQLREEAVTPTRLEGVWEVIFGNEGWFLGCLRTQL